MPEITRVSDTEVKFSLGTSYTILTKSELEDALALLNDPNYATANLPIGFYMISNTFQKQWPIQARLLDVDFSKTTAYYLGTSIIPTAPYAWHAQALTFNNGTWSLAPGLRHNFYTNWAIIWLTR